jgi:hypothetical protein
MEAPLRMALGPLTTDALAFPEIAGGFFCVTQAHPGVAGVREATRADTSGTPFLAPIGPSPAPPSAGTVAGTFCVEGTGNALVDGLFDLPGPGLVSLPAAVRLHTPE